MASLATALTEEIRSTARQELRRQTAPADKAAARCLRDVSVLKRRLKALQRDLSAAPGPTAGEVKRTACRESSNGYSTQNEPTRAPTAKLMSKFSAGALKPHRERLGLSANRYAMLIGVSGLSIYNWEQGEARPHTSSIDAWTAIRRIGKREAAKRLGRREAPETGQATTQAPIAK